MQPNKRLIKVFIRALIFAALTIVITLFCFWYSGTALLKAVQYPVIVMAPLAFILLGILLALFFKLTLTTLVPVKSFYMLGYNAGFIVFLALACLYINNTNNYNKRHGYDSITQTMLDLADDSTSQYVVTGFAALQKQIDHPRSLRLRWFYTRDIDTLVPHHAEVLRRIYFIYCYEQHPATKLFARVAVFHEWARAEIWDKDTQHNAEYAQVKKDADADKLARLKMMREALPDSMKGLLDKYVK